MKKLLCFFGLGLLLSSCGSEAWQRRTFNSTVPQVYVSQAEPCILTVGISTGKVDSEYGSDGWSLVDARGGVLVRAAGGVLLFDASSRHVDSYMNPTVNTAKAKIALIDLLQRDGSILPVPDSCRPNPKVLEGINLFPVQPPQRPIKSKID
jgi:hypothetical protein